MQLWQLGDKHCQKRGGVEDKVCRIILCVETRQEVPAGEKGASLIADSLIHKHTNKAWLEKDATVISCILPVNHGCVLVLNTSS